MGALADTVAFMGDLVTPLGEDDWGACEQGPGRSDHRSDRARAGRHLADQG
jgi:hypothetical protein